MTDHTNATPDRAAETHPFDPRCVCMACGEQIRKARVAEAQMLKNIGKRSDRA